MKEMTKDDVEVVKHYLDKAFHAVGHAAEAASQAFDVRCESEIDAAIEALTMAKGRLNDWPTLRKPEDGAKPKKIADRFKTADEATEAHAKERVLMVFDWAQIKWLYMEDVEGESRLDYLKRCRREGILKSDGRKELERLEKQAAKKLDFTNHQTKEQS